jgi:putative protease
MPYALEVDGREVDLGDKRYLLSPQDLAAVEELPALLRLGVRSFKIEGRLKSPEYVAAVCQVYRRALDAALAGGEVMAGREDWYRMEMTFSRGFFSGWMHGVNHQRLVPARFGKKRGPFVGFVKGVGRDWVEIEGGGVEVVAGDGLVFDTGGDTNAEVGGRVYGVTGGRVEFQRGQLDGVRLRRGDRVWKTSDPRLDRELKQSFAGRVQVRNRELVEARVLGGVGGVLRVEIWRAGVRLVAVDGVTVLERAERAPLVAERFAEHVLTFAEAPFEVVAVDWAVEGEVHFPLGEMNRLRRRLVDALRAVWWPDRSGTGVDWRSVMSGLSGKDVGVDSILVRGGGLRVLCRTMDQLEEVLALGACDGVKAARGGGVFGDALWVALDFEDVRRYAAAVELFRSKAGEGASIFLATPRIQKAGEQGFFRLIENARPDGVLVRNPGAIAFFRGEGGRTGLRLAGDFSLNVANPISAAYFLGMGLETVCVSYDLNAGQVLDLARCGGEWTSRMEVTLHQHMPMFHMEHCVFAAFLSEGSSYLDCGRPCERHDVRLRDRVGVVHPLRADAGCRNTLFNAVAQTGAQHWSEFSRAGLGMFRVELLDENRGETRRILEAYGKLLTGGMDGESLWRGLRVTARLGVTEGTLRE